MEKGKTFNIRISKELWIFLREQSTMQELSMNQIIINRLEKYKAQKEKRKKSVDYK